MANPICDLTLFKLFGYNRHAVTPSGSVQRWMDEGNTISFTACLMHFYNAEFQINSSDAWKIWFSQLNMPLYDGDLDDLKFSRIQFKNGNFLLPVRSNPTEFWNAVKGKHFKVIRTIPCYVPNKANSEVKTMTIGQVYEKVHNAISGGRGNYIKDMLKPQKCYYLIEI